MAQKKEEGKKRRRIFIAEGIFFLFFLMILVGINGIAPDRESSELENRTLAQKPKVTLDGIKSGKFEEQFETYLSDQAVGRDFFKMLQSNVQYTMGKRLFNDIYAGTDHYLIQGFTSPTKKQWEEKVKAINQFQKKQKNCNVYFLLAPTAIGILEEKLPKQAPKSEQLSYIDMFYQSLSKDIKTIDAVNMLQKHKEEPIYYKTDHHWTTLGAYYGYKSAKEVMELKKKEPKRTFYTVANDFQGTLTAGSGIYQDTYDTVEISAAKEQQPMIVTYVEEQEKAVSPYKEEALKEHDKYQVFFGGNHSLIQIETAVDTERKLLVLKDSYGNSMIPFLTEDFAEITIVDPRYYYDNLSELIKQQGITDILFLYNANTFFSDTSLKEVLQS